MSGQIIPESSKKIVMLLLATYPLLYYYVGPANFTYGSILFFLCIIYLLIRGGKKKILIYPSFFFLIWLYATFALWYTNASSFKLTFVIPGGINFFSWALFYGLCSRFLSISYLRKYMRVIFVISALIFIFQFLLRMAGGPSFCAVPPLSAHFNYGDLSYYQLSQIHMSRNRASSIFLEPAYYAQYSLVLLTIEMFGKKDKNRREIIFIVFIITILILLQSGCGYVGLLLLIGVKLYKLLSRKSLVKKIGFLLVVIPIAFFAMSKYVGTDMGANMVGRTSELNKEGSSGYLRVIRGFLVYDNLPTVNKIFGATDEVLTSLDNQFLLASNDGSIFLNGFQMLLIKIGLIGLLFFLIFYTILFRRGDSLARISITLFLLFSLIEQTYLMPYMLMLSTLSMLTSQIDCKRDENSILVTNRAF